MLGITHSCYGSREPRQADPQRGQGTRAGLFPKSSRHGWVSLIEINVPWGKKRHEASLKNVSFLKPKVAFPLILTEPLASPATFRDCLCFTFLCKHKLQKHPRKRKASEER